MNIHNEDGKYVFTFYYDVKSVKKTQPSGIKCTQIEIPSWTALVIIRDNINKILQEEENNYVR